MKKLFYWDLSVIDQHSYIIFVELTDSIRVDLAIAKEIAANQLSFTENKKHYLVADLAKVRGITDEAREFMQKSAGRLKKISWELP